VFYFRSTDSYREESETERDLIRLCDVHNIPLATNIATAEALVMALDSGSLNYRELINPLSKHNRAKNSYI
jgi:methylglyoxal synthase